MREREKERERKRDGKREKERVLCVIFSCEVKQIDLFNYRHAALVVEKRTLILGSTPSCLLIKQQGASDCDQIIYDLSSSFGNYTYQDIITQRL